MNLPDELPAAPAGRKHIQRAISITPHSDDLGDLILASRDHRGDRGMLSAEARTRSGVNAHSRIAVAIDGYQSASNVPEQPVTHLARVKHSRSRGNQFFVPSIAHEGNVPA